MFPMAQNIFKNPPRNMRVIVDNTLARFFLRHSIHHRKIAAMTVGVKTLADGEGSRC